MWASSHSDTILTPLNQLYDTEGSDKSNRNIPSYQCIITDSHTHTHTHTKSELPWPHPRCHGILQDATGFCLAESVSRHVTDYSALAVSVVAGMVYTLRGFTFLHSYGKQSNSQLSTMSELFFADLSTQLLLLCSCLCSKTAHPKWWSFVLFGWLSIREPSFTAQAVRRTDFWALSWTATTSSPKDALGRFKPCGDTSLMTT